MQRYRLTVTVRPKQSSDLLTDTLVSLRARGNGLDEVDPGHPAADKWGTHYRFDVVSREKANVAHATFCTVGLPVCYGPVDDDETEV